jgi:hypothetical protein
LRGEKVSLKIDPERIANHDLTEDEMAYLRDRGQLPSDYVESEEVEFPEDPTIENQGGIESEEEGEEDYEEGWTNDQRRAELSRRKLVVEGRKDDLISRLRRSDSDQLEADDYSNLGD